MEQNMNYALIILLFVGANLSASHHVQTVQSQWAAAAQQEVTSHTLSAEETACFESIEKLGLQAAAFQRLLQEDRDTFLFGDAICG